MPQRSTPHAEALERLSEAMVSNALDLGSCLTGAAAVMGAVADPATTPAEPAKGASDALASAYGSVWLCGLRAVGTASMAATDAVAILAQPPRWFDRYEVDLSWDMPAREHELAITVVSTAWGDGSTGAGLPAVTVHSELPLAVPAAGDPDVLVLEANPAVLPASVTVTLEFTDPAGVVPTAQYSFRLGGAELQHP